MINVEHSKAALNAMTGDVVAVPRIQMAELLAEVEIGNAARRALSGLKTMTTLAASASGIPA